MGKKGTAERGKSKKALQKARVLKAEASKVASASKKADRAAKREAKKAAARKRGKQTKDEDAEFDAQCALLGVRVNVVKGDGNCMFRSIADQLEGNPQEHATYRDAIVQYINDRREDFEPFMEDDEKFDAYIARMGRDGEWGGHQELFAASQHYNCNIVVHQLAAPRFEIHAPVPSLARATLHMSYHGEMHYNSVRQADDFNTMVPPVPIMLRTPSGGAAGGGVLGTADEPEESEEEKLVALSCPDATREQIRSVLRDVGADAEAAIELLIEGYVGDPGDSQTDAHDDAGEGGVGGGGDGGGSGGSGGSDEGAPAEDAAASGDAHTPEGVNTAAGGPEKGGAKDGAAETRGAAATTVSGAYDPHSARSPPQAWCSTTPPPQPCMQTDEGCDPLDPASIRRNESLKERERGGAKKGKKKGSLSPPPGANAKPRRGGDCPCGSGIKYKKCCRKKDLAKGKVVDAGGSEPERPDTSGDAELAAKLAAIVI
mmetsp:Transcript_105475/g.304890  ORF Transcript_105475/g.304890 Transcript_105475/m.304890 type:complete len:487 (-) Transcript_105475:4055-5515(-)